MANVIILDSAQEELENIARLYKELSGPNAARNITDKIYQALERLEQFPHLGMIPKDDFMRMSGYRLLIVENYICVYRLEGDHIYVYHIANARSNYPQLFRRLIKQHEGGHHE